MHDLAKPVPGRYAGMINVMEEMHWSWRDVMEAPADLVEEIGVRMEARGRWMEMKKKTG